MLTQQQQNRTYKMKQDILRAAKEFNSGNASAFSILMKKIRHFEIEKDMKNHILHDGALITKIVFETPDHTRRLEMTV